MECCLLHWKVKFRDKFTKLESFGVDYIFCNDEEAMAFTSTESIDSALDNLTKKEISQIKQMAKNCMVSNYQNCKKLN